uniref:Phospholipase-like protein n=1 Tax=Tanacetum cinerariifolium TaxID=118510 RepID=A0A6L2JZQ4_TANCI|nr:phospholipase-like protein [Tanacetum cinerariifolium]
MDGYEVSCVLVTCRSILQLVILGVESRRAVPDWMLRLANDRVAWNKYPWGSYVWPTLYSQLRNANVKRWSPLYVAQPTNEDDVKTDSIFGYTWAFKTWILESFRVTAIRYFDRYNRYPRVAAWSKKKGRFLRHMVIPFFQGNMPAARLTPDDNEARSDWWISSKAYFDSFIGQVERVPSHMGRPNLKTTIETHHDVDGIFDQVFMPIHIAGNNWATDRGCLNETRPPHNFQYSYNDGLGIDVPQQTNFSDSGVITCWLISYLCSEIRPVVHEVELDYRMNNALLLKAKKLEKQIRDKTAWQAKLLKENVFILDPDGALTSTQEYMQKAEQYPCATRKLNNTRRTGY